jgi:Mg2+ and Co2+ transporter CorA
MANGEEQILATSERRLIQIVDVAVEKALSRLDMATVSDLRKRLEETRYKLADAETIAGTQREVAMLRSEQAKRLEDACDHLKEEKYQLAAQVAMLESTIDNLKATIDALKAAADE